jgi:hypothetical protein
MSRASEKKWWMAFALVVLGSVAGLYLQGFEATERFFGDIVDAGFDTGNLDLVFLKIRLAFSVTINAGTLAGAALAVWVLR